MELEKELSKLITNYIYRLLMDEVTEMEEWFDEAPFKFDDRYIEGYLNALENLAAKMVNK